MCLVVFPFEAVSVSVSVSVSVFVSSSSSSFPPAHHDRRPKPTSLVICPLSFPFIISSSATPPCHPHNNHSSVSTPPDPASSPTPPVLLSISPHFNIPVTHTLTKPPNHLCPIRPSPAFHATCRTHLPTAPLNSSRCVKPFPNQVWINPSDLG